MKQSFFAVLLSLLLSMSAICQAESLTRRFVVEYKESTQSFSVKRSLNSLLDNPKYLADTNGNAGFLPPDDKPHKHGDYGLKMTFIKSISWQWLYATNVLVAYELILTTRDAALRGKPYSWIPEEARVAVGWLLKSYWNPDSLLFNPRGQPEVSQDEPFAITTMMLPGQNQQQSDQQTPTSESSDQQASGATGHVRGSVPSPLSSGSGGDNEGPEQDQHTLGLGCYVDSCHGVCKLRQASNRSESAEGAVSSAESSIVNAHHAMTEAQPLHPQTHETDANVASKASITVSRIIKHMNRLIMTHIINDVHSKATSPSPDIELFRNAITLLELLDPSDISTDLEPFSLYPECDVWDDADADACYHVYYRGKMIFTVFRTANKTSFQSPLTCGFLVSIKIEVLFNEFYYAPDAPGYQSAKSEFEEQRKK
ncbi:hypothetical protein [Endozoicomonas sp. ISHI1]|uniref:hypothetical protein n=2 Tax=unclassified Endozoicomonas TaxID=2644528 RepID=UPI0021479141|nr:hypothetical protein [Endozoicomonas sp. ISHI1]